MISKKKCNVNVPLKSQHVLLKACEHVTFI